MTQLRNFIPRDHPIFSHNELRKLHKSDERSGDHDILPLMLANDQTKQVGTAWMRIVDGRSCIVAQMKEL